MWPDSCSSTSPTSLSGGGTCLHASLDLVQSGTKHSPATCLDASRIAPGGPSRRLYVLGDSHAAMLVSGVKAAFQRSFTVVHVSCVGSGCGFNPDSFFIRLPEPMHSWGHSPTQCGLAVRESWATLNATVRQDDVVMVITASFRYYWNLPREDGLSSQVAFLSRLATEVLAPRGASLVVTDDVPFLRAKGSDCVDDPRACDTDATAILNDDYHDWYHQRGSSQWRHAQIVSAFTPFAAAHANVYFMEALYEPFCVGHTCQATIPGTTTIGYFDDDHINTAGSLYLAPFMACYFYSVGLVAMYG